MALAFSIIEAGNIISLPYSIQTIEENNSLQEQSFSLKHPAVTAAFKQWQFDEFIIRYGKVKMRAPLMIKDACPVGGILMHFNLSGSNLLHVQDTKQEIHFNGLQHNMLMSFIPTLQATWHPGNTEKSNTFLEIQIPEHHFKRIIGDDLACFLHMHRGMERLKIVSLFRQSIDTDATIHHTISQILKTQKKGYLKKVFLEAKILELLSYQLEQHKNFHQDKCIKMKKTDRDALHQAKRIIEEDIANPHSLVDLAHQVGINDFKLKKGFKTLFGKTVFGYIYELRMAKACELLQEQEYTLHEIAESCGYSYAQHFITAFKKNFGVTPGNFLAQKKEEPKPADVYA